MNRKTALATALAAAAALTAPHALSQHDAQAPTAGAQPSAEPGGGRSSAAPPGPPQAGQRPSLAGPAVIHPEERHFRNLRQVTFGGQNAEGYWSPDGTRIVYQRMNEAEGVPCDQVYVYELASGESRRVSNGKGRVTCAYFTDGGRRVLYASTHLADAGCPPPADHSKGYAWPMIQGYDIVSHALDGSGFQRLTETPGYDAEATLSPDGKTIVFTSVRDSDLEIYTMALDGSGVKRLTHEPGYDGGPFFSHDGKRIVYRRDVHPDEASVARYRELLAQGLYRPGALEVWVMNADGSDKRQVTKLGAASFAPYFHPDGKRIIFSSNHPNPRGRAFDLYLIGDDGSGLERVTSEPSFDGFPMFSPDGKKLVFASNRGGKTPGETNLFLVDWVE
jgi:Tol biopolymer transport system component